jgi:hypothetical protein
VGWLSHSGKHRARQGLALLPQRQIISDRYLPVAKSLEKVERDAVIDGELAALDAQGISRFQLLQNGFRAEAKLLCAFRYDVCEGENFCGLPLLARASAASCQTLAVVDQRVSPRAWRPILQGSGEAGARGIWPSGQ